MTIGKGCTKWKDKDKERERERERERESAHMNPTASNTNQESTELTTGSVFLSGLQKE